METAVKKKRPPGPGRKPLPPGEALVKRSVQITPQDYEFIESIDRERNVGFSRVLRDILRAYQELVKQK